MKAVIVGCGRVGAELAELFESGGYDVIILDKSTRAFDRLPDTFRGAAVRGDGTDEDTLRRAGAANADVFISMTEGDNRNVMAAQLAAEVLGARRVIAKINDPLRAGAYASLGIATLCRTTLMRDAVAEYVGLPISGLPGISLPTGQHPGGEHHDVGEEEPILLGAGPGEMAFAGGAAARPVSQPETGDDPEAVTEGPRAPRSATEGPGAPRSATGPIGTKEA
jgi:trk system potassium uptake protein